MDSLTQIVLGAAVGEATLGKTMGNKAMLYGAIAGTIPDLDILSSNFVDTVTALEIHRGFTHSIVFSVVFGLFFGWLTSLYEKRANWKQWSWLWFMCFITHPLLDAHTTWGTQLFWPFDLRLAYKNIFVIDPLYTLPFLVCVVWAAFKKRGSNERRKINNAGLIISSSYMVITLILKGITYHKFTNALEEQNITYRGIQTKPSPFNTILWTANVEVDDAFLIGDYSFFDSKPIVFHRHPKNHEMLGDLKENDKIKRLIAISTGWYTISDLPARPDETVGGAGEARKNDAMYFNDLRFGLISVDPKTEKYAFSYRLQPTKEGLNVIEEPKNPDDAKKLLDDLWERVLGN